MFVSIRLKVINFFKRNKKLIFTVLLLWVIIVIANNFLKTTSFEEFNRTTYSEHESVLGSSEKVPDKLIEPINQVIDTYFNYCNNKNYEEAYAMVSDECKKIYFQTLDDYKEYIDIVFDANKIYYLQNFSNYDGYYIYRMRIIEDLMATGLTGKDELYFYEEKIVLKEDNGKISLSLRQFIANQNIGDIYEDDYIKIWIESKDVFYENEIYNLKIKNKTTNTVVIADGLENKEVFLRVGSQDRTPNNNNLRIVIPAEETKEFFVDFTKFFDETNIIKGIYFNNVRILKQYSGIEQFKEAELENAERLYSIEIPF